MAKTLNTRIQNKIDTEANWNSVTWVPLEGEVIIYTFDDGRAPQIKVGNGVDVPEDLPFSSADIKAISTSTIDALFS